MPMNEYGEIVRYGGSDTPSGPVERDAYYNDFETRVNENFYDALVRNFYLITLGISIPLYAVLGYFAVDYFKYEPISNWTGALIGAVFCLVCVLIYNIKLTVYYEGFEYLLSILFPAGVLIALAICAVAVYFIIRIVLYIAAAVIVFGVIIGVIAALINS